MPTYIALVDWTDQGIRNFRDSVKRGDAFTQACERQGATVDGLYWCLGEHDIVAVITAPDDETATALFLELGALGNVRTKTLRAFNRDEMGAIIARTD